jgi:hypothetical protein
MVGVLDVARHVDYLIPLVEYTHTDDAVF